MVALPNELLNDATRPLSDRLAQSTQKAQMLQTVFNIGYEKFEDTQCRFFQAQSKSTLNEEKSVYCLNPYETVNHILFECPSLVSERRRLLPPLPSLHNCLYTNKEQLLKTCEFFRLAMDR